MIVEGSNVERRTKVKNFVYTIIALALVVAGFVFSGCDNTPKDMALLNSGLQLELRGLYDDAVKKYAEAATLGNAQAFKKLGDFALSLEFPTIPYDDPLKSSDPSSWTERFSNGNDSYDAWMKDARRILSRAELCFNNAERTGYTNQLDRSRARLNELKQYVLKAEGKMHKIREERRMVQKKLQEEKERSAKIEKELAARATEELEKKRKEEERVAREREEREEAERRRLAEEEARKNSPEYCIENNLFLSDVALSEVIKEVNYSADTGNEIKDKVLNREHRGRFLGKHIKVRGTIKQVETMLFTDEVKVIVNVVGGKTISARFDGMSKDEAINLNRGDAILFEGDVSDRPVTSTIAMDRCSKTPVVEL